jgi:two-component system, LytTR family, sensor kinase
MIRKFSIPLLHIGYWLMYSLLFLVLFMFLAFSGATKQDPKIIFESWLKIVIGFAYVPAIFGFYYGYCVAFPQHIAHLKIKKLLSFGLLVVLLSGVLGGCAMRLIFGYNILWNDGLHSAIPQFILMAFIGTINLVLGTIISGFVQSTKDITIKADMERERLQMETHLLRIQVNPHFLFNTLNNIDSLIQSNPTMASTYLHKLSQFMRQLVYLTEDQLMPLDREILLMEDYISLQQIRSKSDIPIQWQVISPTDDIVLPPLLLLPLIENCFKHGLINDHNPLIISIEVKVDKAHLVFENTIDRDKDTMEGGLGLVLTAKRLRGIYQEKAQLNMTTQEHTFKQSLIIPVQP